MRPPRTRPGAKGKGPSYNLTRAAPTPAPARAPKGAQRRCMPALWRRPHRRRLHKATSGAPSSTSCSRRSCVTPTHKSSTARAATPRRAHASPTRCPDPCSTAPASRPTSCTCSSRRCSRSNASHNRCTLIGRTLSEATAPRSYLAQLHHAFLQWEQHAIERLLAMPAMHVDETSLRVDRKNHWIHCLQRRQAHREVPACQTRV